MRQKIAILGSTGSIGKNLLEIINNDISINKNTVYGDKSPMNPGGIRLGSAAMTTRKLKEEDFIKIADFMDECIKLAIEIQEKNGKKLVDFCIDLDKNPKIVELREKVNEFSRNLYFPDDLKLEYE